MPTDMSGLFFNPNFKKLLEKDEDVEGMAKKLAVTYRLPPNPVENLQAVGRGEQPQDAIGPQTLEEYQQGVQPPTDEKEIAENRGAWKNFLTALRDDPDTRNAIAMFGSQLAQGPLPNEQGVGGMFGRAVQTGVQSLTSSQQRRQEAALKERAIGVQEAQVSVQERAAKTSEQQADIKLLDTILSGLNSASSTGGPTGHIPGLTGEIHRLADMWMETGKFNNLAEARDASTKLMVQYNVLKNEVQALANNAMIMDPTDIQRTRSAVEERLQNLTNEFDLETGEALLIRQKLDEASNRTEEASVSTVEQYEGMAAPQAFQTILKANGNPQPGSPLYEEILQEVRSQAPNFNPSTTGTIQR